MNSDINTDACTWFTAQEIADLDIPGYPRSARRIHDRAVNERWDTREVKSAGRTGSRREYRPPAGVLEKIWKRQLARSFDGYRAGIAAGEPLATAQGGFVEAYNSASSTVDLVPGLVQICPEDLDAAIGMGSGPLVREEVVPYAARPSSTAVPQSSGPDTVTVRGETILLGDKHVPWVRVTPPNVLQLIESSWAVRDAMPDGASKDEIMARTVQAFSVLTVLTGGDYRLVERALEDEGVLSEFLALCASVERVSAA